MSATVKSIRQRVQTAIDAVTGFSPSKHPYNVFGRDPASVLHKRYAVGVPRTEPAANRRQRGSVGAVCTTTIAVTYCIRVRPKDQVASYDESLDAEAEIIKAVMADTSALKADVGISFQGVVMREVDPAGEWIIGELEFAALHVLALD
ncbi:MAG TPA: hypothetical protein EYN66_05675 [Myxococcales bacterium]|nr:hypothetical protein [Myxococcales bacterium]